MSEEKLTDILAKAIETHEALLFVARSVYPLWVTRFIPAADFDRRCADSRRENTGRAVMVSHKENLEIVRIPSAMSQEYRTVIQGEGSVWDKLASYRRDLGCFPQSARD